MTLFNYIAVGQTSSECYNHSHACIIISLNSPKPYATNIIADGNQYPVINHMPPPVMRNVADVVLSNHL